MTCQEVEAAVEETQTMLLPVGSTEQHGHHMPLGVDVYLPEAIVERGARVFANATLELATEAE